MEKKVKKSKIYIHTYTHTHTHTQHTYTQHKNTHTHLYKRAFTKSNNLQIARNAHMWGKMHPYVTRHTFSNVSALVCTLKRVPINPKP